MKGLICITVLLLAAVCQSRVVDEKTEEELQTIDDDSSEEFVEDVRKAFEKRCKEVGHEFSKEKFDEAIKSARQCFEEHVPQNKEGLQSLKDEPIDNLCSDKRVSLRKCLKDLIHVAEDCFDEEEKYVPDFLVAGFDGVFELICKDKDILDQLINDKSCECFEAIMTNSSKVEDPKLNENFVIFNDKFSEDQIVKKEDLCHDLNAANKLLNDILTESCPNDVDLRSILAKVHKAIASPCLQEPKTKK